MGDIRPGRLRRWLGKFIGSPIAEAPSNKRLKINAILFVIIISTILARFSHLKLDAKHKTLEK